MTCIARSVVLVAFIAPRLPPLASEKNAALYDSLLSFSRFSLHAGGGGSGD